MEKGLNCREVPCREARWAWAQSLVETGVAAKVLDEFAMSCTCKLGDAARIVPPDRAAGWQFATDPLSYAMLGAREHPVNERSTPNMQVGLLLQDGAAHFANSVSKNQA